MVPTVPLTYIACFVWPVVSHVLRARASFFLVFCINYRFGAVNVGASLMIDRRAAMEPNYNILVTLVSEYFNQV